MFLDIGIPNIVEYEGIINDINICFDYTQNNSEKKSPIPPARENEFDKDSILEAINITDIIITPNTQIDISI